MGNRIFGVDQLINAYIHPANEAYKFKDYRGACHFIWALNNFFLPFGCGINDLPDPTPDNSDMQGELLTDAHFRDWAETYQPKVMFALGYGIKKELIEVIAYNES